MFKRNLIILFFFSFAEIANGQVINSVGIKSGLSIADQTWYYKSINLTERYEYQVGIYGAATVEFFKTKYFCYAADIGYCEKGSKKKMEIRTTNYPEGTGQYATYRTRFNYLTISPLFKARIEISHWIPFIFLGPRLDYQVSYKSDFNLTSIEQDLDKTIWGLNSGCGMEFKRSKIGIITEFQYHYDFTKVVNRPTSPTSAGLAITNSAFIISMGIKYYFVRDCNCPALSH